MLKPGDAVVLFLLMVLVFWLLFRSWRKMRIRPLVLESQQPVQGEIPDWLEREGYEVVAAKQRLPLWIQVGGDQYESRLYADYVALEGEEAYVVILAKAKRALRLSGAAIRDRFLGHVLAFQAAGILYVDPVQGTLKKITFEIQGVRTPGRRRGFTSHLIMMVLGALIAILVR
ncbi:hypothetical protein ACFQ49_08680 [Kroppenstedtia eburnea]|uniref:hypothetical protein n=1 Tax=Kroppenstedtia eburnea TaxID=714067 RepID=UPI00020C6E5C|nr:hypothetical protein HMPREF9374_0306 [Desmospora sp. 8437]